MGLERSIYTHVVAGPAKHRLAAIRASSILWPLRPNASRRMQLSRPMEQMLPQELRAHAALHCNIFHGSHDQGQRRLIEQGGNVRCDALWQLTVHQRCRQDIEVEQCPVTDTGVLTDRFKSVFVSLACAGVKIDSDQVQEHDQFGCTQVHQRSRFKLIDGRARQPAHRGESGLGQS